MQPSRGLHHEIDFKPVVVPEKIETFLATGIEFPLQCFRNDQILEQSADKRIPEDLVACADSQKIRGQTLYQNFIQIGTATSDLYNIFCRHALIRAHIP